MGTLDGFKAFLASKTIWSDILTIVVAAYTAAVPIFNLPTVDGPIVATILAILGGLGIYGRTTATTKIG